ncbi:MAG: hypothetical protein QOC71_1173 [Thermoplasmata archaeon]|jgi:nitric oxide reductase large subunit|nr:hypothetical protein [Thermoplasmata archaeon]
MAAGSGLLRVGSVLLLIGALALFWLAFTRFGDADAPQPGSPGFQSYEKQRVREAQLSVLLGLAGSFVLLGAFACHSKATQAGAAPRPPDAP